MVKVVSCSIKYVIEELAYMVLIEFSENDGPILEYNKLFNEPENFKMEPLVE